jgi:hypothetical protein
MEAVCSSETLAIFYETTMCYNPEDRNIKQTVDRNAFHADKGDLIDGEHSFVLGIEFLLTSQPVTENLQNRRYVNY